MLAGTSGGLCACGRPLPHRGVCRPRWQARAQGIAVTGPRSEKRARAPQGGGVPKRRFSHYGVGGGHVLSPYGLAAIEGRTRFPTRRVAAALADRLLKSGEHNGKIGAKVVKGALAGAKVFTLTLEERATCPRLCLHWLSCFGNNMQWPERIQADGDLTVLLSAELRKLCARHGRILVRLHVLGDFFSTPYVAFWRSMLDVLPGLHIYGYTARHGCPIGREIEQMNNHPRCWIRFSNAPAGKFRAVTIDDPSEARAIGAIVCPAQHHPKSDTICCSSCALCWSTDKTIAFLRH